MSIYNKIYDFCKVRNMGSIFANTDKPTPRVEFLMRLLDDNNIKYELDEFIVKKGDRVINGYNIVMKGTSDKMVVAHHDIVNPSIDNANDNSASVINCIALKKLRPDLNIALLDGEEVGGLGSSRLAEQIKNGDFGNIKWVLNFELTGKGGENFFIGEYPGPLYNHIKSIFDCPSLRTPFNDSEIFRGAGIDSVVINPLPITDDESPLVYKDNYLDIKMLYNCHSSRDTVDTIDPKDMKDFIEKVVLKIV